MKSLFIVVCTFLIYNHSFSQQIYTKQLTDYPVYEVIGIETSNNVLVAAWMEDDSTLANPDTTNGLNKITVLKLSNDGGLTWSAKQVFDNPARNTNANPTLASDDDGVIYLVQMSVDGPPNPNIGTLDLYRSIDDGKTWSPAKVVVPFSISSWPDKPWLIAKGSGELFLVYTDVLRQNQDDTKFMQSLDSGKTWSAPVSLSTGETVGPSISFGFNNEILISWATSDGPMYFTKSTDNGLTFQTPIKVTTGTVPGWSVTELISSASSSHITVVFHDTHALGPAGSVSSVDGGVNWANPIFHTSSGNLISGDVDTAGNIHIVYNETYNTAKMNTYTVSSSDSGKSYSSPVSLYKTTPSPVPLLNKYIGAYQTLVCSKKSDVKHAFWIDWEDNKYHLNYSSWPKSPSFGVEARLLKDYGIEVFPNPVSKDVSFIGENVLPGTIYYLSNSSGVHLAGGIVREEGELRLNLDYLPKGIYFLVLIDKVDGTLYQSKLIKD